MKPAPPAARGRAAGKKPVSAAGVVGRQIRGGVPGKGGAAADASPGRLIEVIRGGLPVAELEALRESLGVPMERLLAWLRISKATFHRRKAQGRLGSEESDRVLRFARLMGKAVTVMEGEDAARRWLGSEQVGLGGSIPLEYAGTEVGAREVEDLLGRIEYGVYS